MKYLLILLLACSMGCAEMDMSHRSQDCNGVKPHRSGTAAYPCVCCPDGWGR